MSSLFSPSGTCTVDVEVEIHDTEPEYDPDSGTTSPRRACTCRADNLDVEECTGGTVAQFRVEPGLVSSPLVPRRPRHDRRVRAWKGAIITGWYFGPRRLTSVGS